MKVSFRKDLQIASVKSQSEWNKAKVHTLLQNVKSETAFNKCLSWS